MTCDVEKKKEKKMTPTPRFTDTRYFGFIQANVLKIKMRQGLRYSVDSQCLLLFRVIDLIAHTGMDPNEILQN